MNKRKHQKMIIGIVLSSPPGYSETFFRSKIKGLQENGVDVILFCRPDKNFNLCPLISRWDVPKSRSKRIIRAIFEYIRLVPYLNVVLNYWRLEQAEQTPFFHFLWKLYLNGSIIRTPVDWLHFGFATLSIENETLAKAKGAKMAVSLRGFDITVYPVKHPDCYQKLWKYVDKIHSLSDYLIKEAKQVGLTNDISVVKIPPAVDVKKFIMFNADRNQRLNLLTVGRLHWIKNFPSILQALKIIKEKGIDFEYHIVGTGKDFERIAYTVYDLDLKEHVFFHGQVSHEVVRQHLEVADIYIQYSYPEGFCNAVLEAQAMGKLCIVSDAGGLTENVLHGKTGWVVPMTRPELLAEQIIKVLQLSGEKQEAFSKRAIARVREEFNLEKQKAEFLKFYDNDSR